MALSNNFIPNTSLVFTPQDFAKQMAERQAEDKNTFQNYFKFGLQLHDFDKNQQIANEMKKADPNYKKIDSLAASRVLTPDSSFSNWRWKAGIDAAKQQRDDDLARIEAEKQKNKDEQKLHIQNKLDSYLPTMNVGLTTSPEQAQQYLNTLAGLEAEANNYGITDPRIAKLKARLSGDLPYNQLMAALDELEDIDANFGKGPDYDRLNDAQKFEVYQRKLEEARQNIIDNDPELWAMMMRDRRYNKKLTDLMTSRRPRSKGTPPARPSTK